MNYTDFAKEWESPSDCIICRTSGSTGTPKEICLPKSEMRKSAWRTIRFFGLDSNSHLHSCVSPDYIGGMMMAVRAYETGAELTWERPSNRPLDKYDGMRIDLLATVPSQMIHILDNLHDMPEIRAVIIGGAPIPSHLRERIAKSGLEAWETYGMTETASHIALQCVSVTPGAFMTLDGIRTYTDRESRLVIEMDGWQRIVTNDIADIAEDGGFTILGRYDNVIITGGKKVHPEVVEDILERELGVPVMISSLPDEKWGERVIMTIEDGLDKREDTNIISKCKNLLPKECVPKEIRHTQVARTGNGKKKRK